MSTSNRWVALISKLLRLTQERQIKWKITHLPDHARSPDERADVAFTTTYKDQSFRIYEYSYQDSEDGELFNWASSLKLEFIDATGRTLYTTPHVAGLENLLDAVKYQTANIDAVLEKILAD